MSKTGLVGVSGTGLSFVGCVNPAACELLTPAAVVLPRPAIGAPVVKSCPLATSLGSLKRDASSRDGVGCGSTGGFGVKAIGAFGVACGLGNALGWATPGTGVGAGTAYLVIGIVGGAIGVGRYACASGPGNGALGAGATGAGAVGVTAVASGRGALGVTLR